MRQEKQDNALRLILFGTSAGLPGKDRDNTSLGIWDGRDALLIDCSATPFRKLLQTGIEPERVRGVILTHRHLDHCYGLPSLLHSFHILRRRQPLHLWAPPEADLLIRGMKAACTSPRTPLSFPLRLHRLPATRKHRFFDCRGFRVHSCPVVHGPPTVAVGITNLDSGRRAVYSSDTSPCDSLVRFARSADLLVMESTFLGAPPGSAGRGHCTVRQAAETARVCGAKRLVLVHLREGDRGSEYGREARRTFPGPVTVGRDMMSLRI